MFRILFLVFPCLVWGQIWDFMPKEDHFGSEALLDLRKLNENVAGENGFVILSEDGESFKTENGDAIRFWAVGGGDNARRYDEMELANFAKFLAKRGVNMIRFHGKIHSVTEAINQANQEEIEHIWRLVEAMKKEGIYTTISPFWPHFIKEIPESWELGDYTGGQHKTYALLYFNEKFQNAYLNWLTQLYSTPNPKTGIALKDEPAVGLIQMLNEDGVFFWTIDKVQPSLRKLMESQFHSYLIDKYGSIEKTKRSWGPDSDLPKDDLENHKMELYPIWMATQDSSEANPKRLKDQMAFYYATQANFYQKTYDHLRKIGCKQLINATNWKTANNSKLLDLERATQLSAEVLGVNRYYSDDHEGPNRGWRVQAGDKYVGQSVLFHPEKLPVNVKQFKGKPFVMTESSWPLPHKYLAEATFLTAAYASLSGFDTYYWFSPRAIGWGTQLETFHPFDTIYKEDNLPIYKFNISNPGYLSAFPANALLYRMGYVKEGEPMVLHRSTLENLWERKESPLSEDGGFDPNRDEDTSNTEASELSNMTFVLGKVGLELTKKDTPSFVNHIAMDTLMKRSNSQLTSNTGELVWDYKNGVCTLNSPKAQGVVGFLNTSPEIALTTLKIKSSNDYASILAVSLDNQPLNKSKEMLIQINTLYRTTGYQETQKQWVSDEKTYIGFEIVKTGQLPWQAENTEVMLEIQNTHLKYAIQLDANGYYLKEINLEKRGSQIIIDLPKDALYVILTENKGN